MALDLVHPSALPIPSARALLDDGARLHQKRVLPITFRRLTTPEDLEASFRLRGQIVLDKGWADELPGGLDRDDDDDDAVHIGGWFGSTLVATGRMLFPTADRLLPTEAAFDVRVPDRMALVEVGRVIVASDVSDASSSVWLALVGALWEHADGRFRWLGANTGGVIRTYRRLGARHETLGPARSYHGEWRSPVIWDMAQFASSYHALGQIALGAPV